MMSEICSMAMNSLRHFRLQGKSGLQGRVLRGADMAADVTEFAQLECRDKLVWCFAIRERDGSESVKLSTARPDLILLSFGLHCYLATPYFVAMSRGLLS